MNDKIKEQLDMIKRVKSTLKQSIIDKKQEIPNDKFSTLIESCTNIDGDDFKQYSTNKEMNASVANKDDKALVYSKDNKILGGLYNYSDNKYNHVETQFDVDKEFVYNGTYLGKSGVENGTMQEFKPTSQESLLKYLDLYNDINENGVHISSKNSKYGTSCRFDSYYCEQNGHTGPMPYKYILDDDITRIYFNGNQNLTNLCVVNNETSSLSSLTNFINNCRNLKTVDLSNLHTKNVTEMTSFASGAGMVSINVSNLDTGNVTNMKYAFNNCKKLENLDLSSWDVSKVKTMESMFSFCSSLANLNLGDNWNTESLETMRYMFSHADGLKTIDLHGMNTKNVKDMYGLFFICQLNLEHVILGDNWDTGNVTDMANMFNWCFKLKTIDNTKWNTSNVTTFNSLFNYCYALESVDVSDWDTSNVTDMGGMFAECRTLKNIDVSKWNTSKVTNMKDMFFSQTSPGMAVTELDVSNWDVSNVINMEWLFRGCSALQNLDISKWNLASATNMQGMFASCSKLTEDNIRNILIALPTATSLAAENKTLSYLSLEYKQRGIAVTLPEWEACVAAGWKVE